MAIFIGKPCKKGHSGKRYLLNNDCVECAKLRSSKYNKENPEQYRKSRDKYRINNLDKFAAKEAKRRAIKYNATPSWLNKEDYENISKIYELAQYLKFHVDHIVPLKNKKVCGLHVPWNLRVIPPKDNMKKHNTFEVI